jgi:hypothetical protein
MAQRGESNLSEALDRVVVGVEEVEDAVRLRMHGDDTLVREARTDQRRVRGL